MFDSSKRSNFRQLCPQELLSLRRKTNPFKFFFPDESEKFSQIREKKLLDQFVFEKVKMLKRC